MNALADLDLNTLIAFDALVDAGSFTAAAARLDVPKAKVSIQVARLEKHLGLALFTRTTRQVALTEAGRVLHQQCLPLLQGLQAALAAAGEEQAALAGRLRVSSSVEHAAQWAAPALAAFAQQHPGLSIDLRASDRVQDLVGEGVDVAIRMGWLRDSSLRAVKLGEFEQVLLASPDYLARAERPSHPSDLARHHCLVHIHAAPDDHVWRFEGPRGNVVARVTGSFYSNSALALRKAALAGLGITLVPRYSVADDLATGMLVTVLPRYRVPPRPLMAIYPRANPVPKKVQSFVEFLTKWMATRDVGRTPLPLRRTGIPAHAAAAVKPQPRRARTAQRSPARSTA